MPTFNFQWLLLLILVLSRSTLANESLTSLASKNELPFMANVFIISIGTCNGAILSDRWIVVSAYCLTGQVPSHNNPIVVSPTSFLVVVGTNSRTGETSHAVQQIIFDSQNGGRSDLALIELKKGLSFNQQVQPIPISLDPPTPGIEVSSAGWIPTLGKTKMNILPITDCESIPDQNLCVGGGFCVPGVGGPLYTQEDGVYKLLGLKMNSSVLHKPEIECFKDSQEDNISIFTHLGYHLEYIQGVTGLTRNYLLGNTRSNHGNTIHHASFNLLAFLLFFWLSRNHL
ncbi:Mannan-binding lectin serine protease 1 [Basidiobolus ranarum]|uniref:Mannan-binding lectin serine protease 1 n=1 Tax=Basidiobolus ranarum TaxID=34480 RepID=A0ABR2W7F5_9FUNG